MNEVSNSPHEQPSLEDVKLFISTNLSLLVDYSLKGNNDYSLLHGMTLFLTAALFTDEEIDELLDSLFEG